MLMEGLAALSCLFGHALGPVFRGRARWTGLGLSEGSLGCDRLPLFLLLTKAAPDRSAPTPERVPRGKNRKAKSAENHQRRHFVVEK